MRGLIPVPDNTILGKTDYSEITSMIRVVDQETLTLEVKNESKLYVIFPPLQKFSPYKNFPLTKFSPYKNFLYKFLNFFKFPTSLLEQANMIKMKYYTREIYGLPPMGFRIARITYEKFDFGVLDETDYSRIFKFYIDDDTAPLFLGYQYTKNGRILIYQNLNQPKVKFSIENFL